MLRRDIIINNITGSKVYYLAFFYYYALAIGHAIIVVKMSKIYCLLDEMSIKGTITFPK